MDLGDLNLEEITSSLSNLGKEVGTLKNAFNSLTNTGNEVGDAGKQAHTGLIGFAMKLNETLIGLTNLTNELDDLDTKHRLFEQRWNARFQEFEFQKESTRYSTIGAEINYAKATMPFIFNGQKAAADIVKARIEKLKSEFAYQRQLINEQQALLGIERAVLGLEQARLSLEQAEIQAARAALDYANRLWQIENNLLSARKAAAEAPKNYVKALESIYEPFIKIDQAASTYTKTIGGSRESMKALRKETIDLATERKLQAKYNTSVEELITLQTKYNTELGRSVKLTNDQKENLAALKQVYGDEKAVEFATKLSSFGYDMTRASSLAGKMFAEASKRGIALDKYSKNLLTNIKMAQTLTFQKGVDGLREMAARATELNFNMQETAKATDKLSTLEGALEASSQLAVLGGNFAQFANPLAMFNEALNDAEGLQERIINMSSGLASWDSNRGEIYMSGRDRIRLREAAKAMGMDPNELISMSFEKARKDKLAPEIDRLGVSDDIKQLLSNVAQLDENGNGYININGKKTSMQEAAQMNPEELSKILRTQNNSDSENISEIAESVLSIKDNVEGWTKTFGDMMAQSLENSGIGDSFGSILKGEASSTELMSRLANDVLTAEQKKAEFDRDYAYWQKRYAEETNAYEKEAARIQLTQALYGKIAAEQNLRQAEFSLKLAEISGREAPLQTKLMKIQNEQVKKYAEDEAKLGLQRKDLAQRQARFQEEVQLPLQQEQLLLDYRKAQRIDDIYEAQRMQIVMKMADAYNGIFKDIPIIGGWLTKITSWAIAGPAMWKEMKNTSDQAGNAREGFWKAMNGNTDDDRKFDYNRNIRGFSPKEKYRYDNQYATGGVVRGDRRFENGGITQPTDFTRPSNADDSVKVVMVGDTVRGDRRFDNGGITQSTDIARPSHDEGVKVVMQSADVRGDRRFENGGITQSTDIAKPSNVNIEVQSADVRGDRRFDNGGITQPTDIAKPSNVNIEVQSDTVRGDRHFENGGITQSTDIAKPSNVNIEVQSADVRGDRRFENGGITQPTDIARPSHTDSGINIEALSESVRGDRHFENGGITQSTDIAKPSNINIEVQSADVRGDRRFYDGGMLQPTDIGGLLMGPSHSDGGIKIEAQGGEYIMPREQTSIYYDILEAMRSKSFPTGNGGFNSMNVNNTSTSIFNNRYWGGGPGNFEPGPLKLDVTGTITLDLSGSTANIDAEDLLREPLISQLVAAISRSQNSYNNYGLATETNLLSPYGIQ